MAKEKETKKSEKVERTYVIPLREKIRPVPRYKKTPKAVKTIKEFLVRHMKIRDGDLNKIKIDTYLNEQLWMRGIKKTLHKVKVKVVKDAEFVRVYSTDLPEKINFKKIRLEKVEAKAKAEAEKKKTLMEKAKQSIQGKSKEDSEKTPEEKVEEKEKEESSKLAQEALNKEKAEEMKHTVKPKSPKDVKNTKVGYNQSSRGH